MNGLDDPDYIVKEASAIEDVLYLRNSNQLYNDSISSSAIEIDIGNGFKRKLSQYLSVEEINKYMTHFTFSDITSVSDILKQYDANYEIIKAIDNKINAESNYDEYMVWSTIKKANMISKNINILFQGYTNYSEYIEEHDFDFWNYIESIITNREIGYRIELKTLLTELQEAYRDYIISVTQGQIVLEVDEKNIAGGENIVEIATLFNEFMSYYTQLFRYDFSVGYDDPNNNSLYFLYAKVFEKMFSSDSELLIVAEKLISDRGKSPGFISNLELVYYITNISKSENSMDLILLYEKFKDIMKSTYTEHSELSYEKYGEKMTSHNDEQLALVEAVSYSA
jgi:hypothetical protein